MIFLKPRQSFTGAVHGVRRTQASYGVFLKFLEKIVFPLIYAMLFLGGVWPAEPGNWLASTLVVLIKYVVVLTLITVIDNSMPRFRPDQGVRFLWKYCYTLALLGLAVAILS